MPRLLWKMNIFFHHICGKMTNMSLIYCNAYADVGTHEEEDALNKGWAVDEWASSKPRVWFQGRQVRLKVSEFKVNKKIRRVYKRCSGVTQKFELLTDSNIEELQKVYDRYMEYKGFSDDLGSLKLEEEIDKDNKAVFKYYDEGTLRAFTLVRLYSGGHSMSGLQFCWDYHNPKLALGKYSLYKEIEHSTDNGFGYLYMMPGYEKTCLYKSDFPGFEFWDGEKWSDDKDLYKSMCENDSKVKTFEEMNELMWNYERNYFKTYDRNS